MGNSFLTIAKVDTSKQESDHPRVGIQDTTNQWYTVWDRKLWPRLVEGAALNVEWKLGGRDNTLRTITGILGTSPTTSNGQMALPMPNTRDHSIARQVALKCAVEIWCASHADAGMPTSGQIIDILTIAKDFTAWIEEREEESPF